MSCEYYSFQLQFIRTTQGLIQLQVCAGVSFAGVVCMIIQVMRGIVQREAIDFFWTLSGRWCQDLQTIFLNKSQFLDWFQCSFYNLVPQQKIYLKNDKSKTKTLNFGLLEKSRDCIQDTYKYS